MLVNEWQNKSWDKTRLNQSYSWGIKTYWVRWKVNNLIWDEKTKKINELIKFRETIIDYYWEIMTIAQNKSWDEFSVWHENHIVILQSIYKKLFPNYEKFTAWHCFIWATPDYEQLEYGDFPWQYSLMHFLVKFKLELDKTEPNNKTFD